MKNPKDIHGSGKSRQGDWKHSLMDIFRLFRMPRQFWQVMVVVLLIGGGSLGLAAASGNDSEPFVLPLATDGVQRTIVVLESYAFRPSYIIAKVGVPIQLILQNESFLVPHNFVLDDPLSGIHLERNVEAGEEAIVELTLAQAGIYHFYCDKQLLFFRSHREKGMEGTIEVR